ncbi:MAG: pyridoxal-phosphate dependent enzyme [Actinobacteria bacterium]|nr:pyridoxal-phosphate dependent enzyme [Actinomycetota bacterium]
MIPLDDIERARDRIASTIVETPLVRLHLDDAPAEIWLKLESFQPIGSFKLRGAANAILSAPRAELQAGVVTTSTGNMAQGVAWMARALGVPATIVVPDNASAAKLAAVERLGGRIVRVPWEKWWAAVEADSERDLGDGVEGYFVHPVRDEPVMAGNGTIGLELVQQLDDIDAVLIPWGGGGLTSGVASALKAVSPVTKIYVCEPDTGAPVTAAIANGGEARPVEFTPSFVDGAGSGSLLPDMWERARPLIAGSFAISLEDTTAAMRVLLQRARIVAEGAAALPVAAALSGAAGSGRVVCIVSGGNIDSARLAQILAGNVPD